MPSGQSENFRSLHFQVATRPRVFTTQSHVRPKPFHLDRTHTRSYLRFGEETQRPVHPSRRHGMEGSEQRGIELLRKPERRPYRPRRNEVHPRVRDLSSLQPLPGKYLDGQVSDQSRDHDLDRRPRWRSLAWRWTTRQPPSPRIRAEPEGLRDHLGRGHEGRRIQNLFRRKMASWEQGIVAYRSRLRNQQGRMGRGQSERRLFLSLAKPKSRIRSEGRISHFTPWTRNRLLHRRSQGPTLSRLPFLLHRTRPDPNHARALEKIPEQGGEEWPGQGTFCFRPTAQRPPSPRLSDLCRDDRIDGQRNRNGPRQT